MHFTFTDEQSILVDTAKAFFAEHATSKRTRAAMSARGIDGELWRSFTQELGFGGITVPEDLGGAGLGMVELAIVSEAAGANVAALPMLGSIAMTAQAIVAGGTLAQKSTWLPKLIAGEKIGACAGSDDLMSIENELTGTASFLPHGDSANVFVLGRNGEAWIVDQSAVGLTVSALTTMDQTRPYARLTLASVRGESLADGAAGLMAARHAGWICVAAEALGGAQACLDKTVSYSLDRVQFGRQIGSFQAYKHRLADMMIEIEQARSAVYWAACAVDEGAEDAHIALHSAKAFAADTYMMCAGNMIQLHGGIGFTWEHDAHLYFKRARAISSILGSSDWHRENIARLIGLGDAA